MKNTLWGADEIVSESEIVLREAQVPGSGKNLTNQEIWKNLSKLIQRAKAINMNKYRDLISKNLQSKSVQISKLQHLYPQITILSGFLLINF